MFFKTCFIFKVARFQTLFGNALIEKLCFKKFVIPAIHQYE
ncbi:hypothetical protein BROSI_A2870 [Candidatus Brocadia sinica JPN1]|uniref:Uncharacterized protein n=1 Tax=Candidatus Brocadia sinica JPN1 TaxID=1197129 RepID=A0ABQ0K0Q9_9BACT|nr:hypothetical protein BROSI_A2870 [Candidatus Brocadia sinica JPN1]